MLVYEDIKNQKIDIRPCLMLLMAGLLIRLISGNTLLSEYLWGMLPGCAAFFSGRLFGHWIGEGDCLLILSIGILEGVAFCMKLLFLSCIGIFTFSVYMLAAFFDVGSVGDRLVFSLASRHSSVENIGYQQSNVLFTL